MQRASSPTAQKLMSAFMQFKKLEWHRRAVSGHSMSEIKVLFCIRRASKSDTPGMKVSEISKLLRVTSPSITQLLKGLESSGLVERHVDATDRRAVVITLTAKGEGVARQAVESYCESLRELTEYLGEEASNRFAELLVTVVHYYQQKEPNVHQSPWDGSKEA